jgi:hypothetical protein
MGETKLEMLGLRQTHSEEFQLPVTGQPASHTQASSCPEKRNDNSLKLVKRGADWQVEPTPKLKFVKMGNQWETVQLD